MTTAIATCEEAVRTPSRTPLAGVAALVLLAAATSACAPKRHQCSPQPDHFDRNRSTARENDVEVLPAVAAAAVAFTAIGMLAGHRCD